MNKFAKWLVLALCLALFAAMFVGCGPKTPETSATPGTDNTEAAATPTPAPTEETPAAKYMKAGETYRILIWSNTYEDQWIAEAEGISRDLLLEAYNKMKDVYGVTPLYVAAPGNWLGDTMDSAYAGSPITDLFHFGGPFTLPSIYTYGGEKGAIIESISDFDIDFSDPEYWDQTTMAAGTFGGKQYVIAGNAVGYGAAAVNVVTFFNKELIKKGGYTAQQLYDWSNNGEWTFDKFREVAKNCTDLDNGVYGTGTVQNCLLLASMVASNGSDLITKKDGMDTFNLTDSKALTAVNFLTEMARDDKSVLVDRSSEEAVLFGNGLLATMVTYLNRLDVKALNTMADDYGILMPPKGPDATDYISDKNWFDGYVVLKNIPNPAGAFEFASIYMKPIYGLSSEIAGDLMAAELTSRRLDEESINIAKKIPAVNHTTTYMIYWSVSSGSDSIASICCYQFPSFVDGSLSPDTYYASMESVANSIIASAMGGGIA